MRYEKYKIFNGEYDLKGNGTKIADIPYKTASEKNKLDIYHPAIIEDKYPVVIFVHGGGLFKSDKMNHLSNVLHCLERGYAVIPINYRLNDECTYLEIQNDVIDAIEWVAVNAKQYKLDKDKIALWGETHGAYMSQVFGVLYEKGLFERECKVHVKGIVSYYAPNFTDFYSKVLKYDNDAFQEKNAKYKMEKLFECSLAELPNKLKSYDLYDKIDGTEPPFYLLHGSEDHTIDQSGTIRFSTALTEHKVSNVFDFVKGGTHGIDFYDEAEYNEPVLRFLDSVFY